MKEREMRILSIEGHYLTEKTSQFVCKEIRTWFSDVFDKDLTFEECQKAIYEYSYDIHTILLSSSYQVLFMVSNGNSELFDSELAGIHDCTFIVYELTWGSISEEDDFFLKLYESINKIKLDLNEFRRAESSAERLGSFISSIKSTNSVEELKIVEKSPYL